jgi:hypothetical protein
LCYRHSIPLPRPRLSSSSTGIHLFGTRVTKSIGHCVQLYDLREIYKNAPVILPAQRICAPPHYVITGTDHLTIHPVGCHVEGLSTHQILTLYLCLLANTNFVSHREENMTYGFQERY